MADAPASNNAGASNNIVAVLRDRAAVADALRLLRDAGFTEGEVSVLARDDASPESASPEDAFEASQEAGKGVAKGAALGTAAGGIAGMVGGLIAFAIPGIGPGLGAGIMAVGLASGAVAGATAGAMWGGMEKVWDMQYRDEVVGGAVLVGVHVDEPERTDQAKELLAKAGADRVDHFDAHGEVIRES